MDKVKISVIMPTYNRSQHLKTSVPSVLKQSYANFELIIIDDGSTDDTEDVIKKFADERIKYFKQANLGVVASRRSGILKAKGDFICFLDDDDEYCLNKFESQLKFFDENPHIDFLYNQVLMQRPSGDVIYPEKGITKFIELLEGCVVQISSVMVRSKCFNNQKYSMQMGRTIKSSDDYYYWLNIFKHYNVGFVPEVLSIYKWHGENDSCDVLGRYKQIMALYDYVKTMQLNSLERCRIKEIYAEYAYRYAMEFIQKEKYFSAARMLIISILTRPTVGLYMRWSKHDNVIYRTAKPYFAIVYLLLKGLVKGSKH